MAINVPAIVELIAHRPKIRTVEIADIIDCDPDHVQPALQKCIDAGDIVVHPVIAPNGRPANGFECSERFKRTDLHKAFMKTAPAPEPAKPVLQIPSPAKAKTVIPVFTNKRKAELGIDCIKANGGKATHDQLRTALGLTSKQYPSTWMHLDVRNGNVHYDGEFWRMGPEPIEQTESEAPKAVDIPAFVVTPKHHVPEATETRETREIGIPASKTPETVTEPGKSETIQRKIETPTDSPAPALLELDPVNLHRLPEVAAPAQPAPAARAVYDPDRYTQEFACAVWSDGSIQVRRFGIDVAVFTPAEVKTLRRFVNSMLAAA